MHRRRTCFCHHITCLHVFCKINTCFSIINQILTFCKLLCHVCKLNILILHVVNNLACYSRLNILPSMWHLLLFTFGLVHPCCKHSSQATLPACHSSKSNLWNVSHITYLKVSLYSSNFLVSFVKKLKTARCVHRPKTCSTPLRSEMLRWRLTHCQVQVYCTLRQNTKERKGI